eukprot:IDg4787t1
MIASDCAFGTIFPVCLQLVQRINVTTLMYLQRFPPVQTGVANFRLLREHKMTKKIAITDLLACSSSDTDSIAVKVPSSANQNSDPFVRKSSEKIKAPIPSCDPDVYWIKIKEYKWRSTCTVYSAQ